MHHAPRSPWWWCPILASRLRRDSDAVMIDWKTYRQHGKTKRKNHERVPLLVFCCWDLDLLQFGIRDETVTTSAGNHVVACWEVELNSNSSLSLFCGGTCPHGVIIGFHETGCLNGRSPTSLHIHVSKIKPKHS